MEIEMSASKTSLVPANQLSSSDVDGELGKGWQSIVEYHSDTVVSGNDGENSAKGQKVHCQFREGRKRKMNLRFFENAPD
jgi:hypothetical protein